MIRLISILRFGLRYSAPYGLGLMYKVYNLWRHMIININTDKYAEYVLVAADHYSVSLTPCAVCILECVVCLFTPHWFNDMRSFISINDSMLLCMWVMNDYEVFEIRSQGLQFLKLLCTMFWLADLTNQRSDESIGVHIIWWI